MPNDTGFFLDIVRVVAAAFAGGVAARLLRLPVIIGYLAVGMVIGPHALALAGDVRNVSNMAQFGVILLLFAIGLEVSFGGLTSMGRAVTLGGVALVSASIGLGYLLGLGLGWPPTQALVFGLILTPSSTAVVLKVLNDRRELLTLHGRLLTGFQVMQDLAFIPMMALLPALTGGSNAAADLVRSLGLAFLVLGGMGLLGWKLVPWVVRRVASIGSREIFLVTLVALTFVSAALAQWAGFSAALGAFVAGLALSESDFGHRALTEIKPLRDTFSALFFVSLGMLTDPGLAVSNTALIVLVLGAVIVVKLILTVLVVRAFRYTTQTALRTGMGMAQIGEFSFLLAGSAVLLGLVDQDFVSIVVFAAVVTMALTPGMMEVGSRLAVGPRRPGRRGSQERGLVDIMAYPQEHHSASLRGHIVIAGLGRVGSLVAETLSEMRVPFVAIDLDPYVVDRCRGKAWHGIHGPSDSDVVLRAANIESALLLLVTTGDPAATLSTAEQALRIHPGLHVVARVQWREEGERLLGLGVREVIWPEMEAGLEALRHTLLVAGAPVKETEERVVRLRKTLAAQSLDVSGSSGDPPAQHFAG